MAAGSWHPHADAGTRCLGFRGCSFLQMEPWLDASNPDLSRPAGARFGLGVALGFFSLLNWSLSWRPSCDLGLFRPGGCKVWLDLSLSSDQALNPSDRRPWEGLGGPKKALHTFPGARCWRPWEYVGGPA